MSNCVDFEDEWSIEQKILVSRDNSGSGSDRWEVICQNGTLVDRGKDNETDPYDAALGHQWGLKGVVILPHQDKAIRYVGLRIAMTEEVKEWAEARGLGKNLKKEIETAKDFLNR